MASHARTSLAQGETRRPQGPSTFIIDRGGVAEPPFAVLLRLSRRWGATSGITSPDVLTGLVTYAEPRMFRKKGSKKRSKDKDEERYGSIRERMELGDAQGPTSNGHGVSGPDEEQDEHEFTESPDEHLERGNGEVREGDRAFNVARNDEARPATEDEVADKVNTIWRRRFEDDPEGALVDLRGKVNQLGYRLAYAGRTYRAPITKRTYYIVDQNKRRMDVFHDGVSDLTLLDVCLWSELAFKKWTNS
jgi:hypothetical protein